MMADPREQVRFCRRSSIASAKSWKDVVRTFTLLFLLASNFAVPGLTTAASDEDAGLGLRTTSASPADQSCFCQLQGQIDDCTCNVDTVDHYNNVRIYPRLTSVLSKNYFRFFKVNLRRPCPFWSDDDGSCSVRDCSVKPCSEEQLPEGLKTVNEDYHAHHNKYTEEAQQEDECEQERKLGHLNTEISDEKREDFARWKKHDEAQDYFCQMDDETSSDMQYVDLFLNPERYTGYKGQSAHRIWRSIYEENCFKPHPGYGQYLNSQSVNDVCLEKRVFYRAISGLHSSINVHLSARYLMESKTVYGISTWGRNVEEFQKRFDLTMTGGEGPMRLKNLYFLYLLELRALAKAAPYLTQGNFYTGNEEEDTEVRHAVSELLGEIKSFPDHFNETSMFTGDKDSAVALKEEFRLHFLNISRIMDCVGCEKCRLWGKLQVQGLGAALKILFSGEQSGGKFNLTEMKKSKFHLTRTEIFSLFNAFGRLSNSIYELESFRKLIR